MRLDIYPEGSVQSAKDDIDILDDLCSKLPDSFVRRALRNKAWLMRDEIIAEWKAKNAKEEPKKKGKRGGK